MKQLLTIALLLVFLSCGQNNKSNRIALLTSSIWTIKKRSILGDFTEKYKFLADGTCLLVAGETEAYGKWSWAEDDEIHISIEGTVVNGQKIKADGRGGFSIRIVELNDKIFRTLEKLDVDNWGSGLVKEGKYSASSLW